MPLRRLLFELSMFTAAALGAADEKHEEWRRPGSNRRPPACKAGALPAELRPHARSEGAAVQVRRRGPFWIRTRDLTVISRAL